MATRKQQPKPATVGPADRGLKVVSRREGFRRAGFVFSAEARTIPLSKLTPEQYEAITEEPQLVCQEVDIESPEPEDTTET